MASRPDDRKPTSRSTPLASRTTAPTSRTTPSTTATTPRLAASSSTPTSAKPPLRAPSRLTGTTASKPPSRPTTLSATRKNLSTVSDASSAGDADENRRPGLGRRQSSLAAAGVGSASGPRVAGSAGSDAGRASRLGGTGGAGGTAKKPVSSRASLGGPVTGVRTAASRTTGSAGGATTARPSTATSAGPIKPRLAAQPHTPKKLELRKDLDGDHRGIDGRTDAGSIVMSSPVRSHAPRSGSPLRSASPIHSSRPSSPLKPLPPSSAFSLRSPPKLRYAASDNEFELARNGKGHTRSQSEVVPSRTRPLTAPSDGNTTNEEQRKKDMRIMGDLLREANLRDILQAEIATLKTKLFQMEKDRTEAENAPASGPKKLEERGAEFARWKAEAKEEIDALRNIHARELSALRADVERQRRGVEEEHAKEVAALRSENQTLEALKKEHTKEVGLLKSEVEKGRRRGNSIEASKTKEIAEAQKRVQDLEHLLVGAREKGVLDGGKVKTEHDKQIAALKHEIEVEKKLRDEGVQEIAAIKDEGAKDIASLRAEAEKHKQRAKSLETSGAKEMAEVQQKVKSLQSQLEDARKTSSASEEDIKSSHAKALEELTKKKQEQAKDISILKKDVAEAEHARTLLAKEVATLQKDLSTQRKAAATATNELSTLKSAHRDELERLKSEHESQLSNHHKLSGVEARIADVQAALEQSKTAATKNEKDLKQKIEVKEQDREMLAQVIRDLEVEIGRCQEQLDADSAKIKGEREALRKTTAEAEAATKRMQKEVAEMRKQREKDVADAAESRKKLEEEVVKLRKTSEKERAELSKAAADAKESGEKLQQELESLRQARETELAEKENALKTSEEILQKMRTESEEAEKRHSEELARATEQASETERLTQSLQEELQTLKGLNEQDSQARSAEKELHDTTISELQQKLETLQREGSDGNQVVSDLQSELKKLQESRTSAESEHEMKVLELNNLIHTLQTDAQHFEDLTVKLKAEKEEETKHLQATLEEMQQKSQQLQTRLADAEAEKQRQIDALTAAIEDSKKETSEMQNREAEASKAKEVELEQAQTALADLQAELMRLKTESSEFKDRQEDEVKELNTVLETLRKEADQASNSRDEETDTLKQNLEKKDQAIEAAKNKYLTKVNDLNATITTLQSKVSEGEGLRQVVEELQVKISTLQQEVEDSQNVHSRVLEEAEKKYLDKVNELNATVSELEKELETTRTEHSDAFGTAKNAHAEVEAKHLDKIGALTAEIEGLQLKVSDGEGAKGVVEELQSTISELKQEIELTKAEHSDAFETSKNAHAEVESKHLEKINTLTTEIEGLQQQVSDSEGAKGIVEELQSTISELKQEIEENRAEHADAFKQSSNAHAEVLGAAEARYLDKINILTSEIDTLQQRVSANDDAAAKVNELNDSVTDLLQELDTTRAEHFEALKKSSTAHAEVEAKHLDKISTLTTEIEDLQQTISDGEGAKDIVEELQTKIRTLQQDFDDERTLHEEALNAKTTDLQAAETKYLDKVNELNTEISELRQQVTDSDAGAKEIVRELQGKITTLQEDVEAARLQHEEEVMGKVSELEAAERKYLDKTNELNAEISGLQQKISDGEGSKEVVAELQDKILELKEEVEAAKGVHEEEVKALKDMLDETAKDLEGKISDLEARDERVKELETSLETTTARAAEAEKNVSAAQADLTAAEKRISQLTADLTRDVESKDGEISGLREQVLALEKQVTESTLAATEAERRVQDSRAELEKLEEQIRVVEDGQSEESKVKEEEIAALKGQIQDLEASFQASKSVADDLLVKEGEVTTLREQVKELESGLETGKSVADDLLAKEGEVTTLREQVKELGSSLDSTTAIAKEAETKVQEALADMDSLQTELATLKESHAQDTRTKDQGLEAKETAVTTLTQQIQDLESQVQNGNLAAGDLTDKYQEALFQMTQLQEEKDALLQTQSELAETKSTEISAMKQSIFELESDLEVARSSAVELKKHISELANEALAKDAAHEKSFTGVEQEKEALETEIQSLRTAHDEEVKALRESHARDVGEVVTKFESEHAVPLRELSEKHDVLVKEKDDLEKLVIDAQEKEMAALRDLEVFKSSASQAKETSDDDDDDAAEAELEALREELQHTKDKYQEVLSDVADKATRLEELTEQLSSPDTQTLQTEHDNALDKLRALHTNELADLKQRYAEPLTQLEHRYATLERERDDAEYRVISLRDAQADEIMGLQDNHERETGAMVRKIEELTARLASAKDESSESASASKVIELETTIARLESELEHATTTHHDQVDRSVEAEGIEGDNISSALQLAEKDNLELLRDRDETISALQDQVVNQQEAFETRLSSALHERDEEIATLRAEIEGLMHSQQQQSLATASAVIDVSSPTSSSPVKVKGGLETGGDTLDRASFIRETEDLKQRVLDLETQLEVSRLELEGERERIGRLRRGLVGGVVLTGDGGVMEDPFADEGVDPSIAFGIGGGGHEGSGVSTPVLGAEDQSISSDGGFGSAARLSRGGSAVRMSTLEGTLASLRIQAKQLEELNEEFLVESSRWQGSLGVGSPRKSTFGSPRKGLTGSGAFTPSGSFTPTLAGTGAGFGGGKGKKGDFVFEQSPLRRRDGGLRNGNSIESEAGAGDERRGSGFGSPGLATSPGISRRKASGGEFE